MTEVTVDLDDLKALVYATSAIKGIEVALSAARRDVTVQEWTTKAAAASNRLASVMRNAERGSLGTAVNWDEPLTNHQTATLRFIVNTCDGEKSTRQYGRNEIAVNRLFAISAADKEDEPVYDHLAAKGCIEIGQAITAVIWPGAAAPSDFLPDPNRPYLARVTARGRQKLKEAEAAFAAAKAEAAKP